MNRLKGLSVYLSGGIDRAKDFGRGWREEITPIFQDMGVKVLNPLDKPYDISCEREDFQKENTQLRQSGKYDELSSRRAVRLADLHMVDESHFLFVCLDQKQEPCGTWEELFWGNRLKRPIIIWAVNGKQNLPTWLFWTCDHNLFFDTVDECLQHLIKVDSGLINNKRWLFYK